MKKKNNFKPGARPKSGSTKHMKMPFKKGDRLGKKNHKFNPKKKHKVEAVPLKNALFIKLANGKLIPNRKYKGEPYTDHFGDDRIGEEE